jgi:hypothetical protein
LKRLIANPLTIVVAVTVLASLAAVVPAHSSGMIFGVRPGQLVQRAYFGADMGRVVPMVGLDFLGISASVEDVDISASIYVPHVGARFYFGPPRAAGNVVPYIEGSLMFSFATADLGGADELEDLVKDALGFWGVGVLFGAEYFFTDRFSVAGEYGLHYLKDSIDATGDDPDAILEADVDAGFKTSYTGVALNFHF